jgi:hypothetical protein
MLSPFLLKAPNAPLEVFADCGAPSLSQRHTLSRDLGLAFQQLLSSWKAVTSRNSCVLKLAA